MPRQRETFNACFDPPDPSRVRRRGIRRRYQQAAVARGRGGDRARHGRARRAGVPRPEADRRAAGRVQPQFRRDRDTPSPATSPRWRIAGSASRWPTSPISTRIRSRSPATDRARLFNLGNRLWHSDSSFRAIPAKYSLLSGRIVADQGGNTEFADMRAAYDALDDETSARGRGSDHRALAALLARHSSASPTTPTRSA